MSANCKAGDLAIVVGLVQSPENNGRIVHVLSRVTHGERFTAVDGRSLLCAVDDMVTWRVRSERPMPWKSALGTLYFLEIAIGAINLIPIGGVPVDEEQHDEVTA